MACFALLPRTLLYCSNCGKNVGTERITNVVCSQQSGGCEGISIFHGSAVRRAHGSSAEHAMRDLIASHAPLREGRHKARQNGPKHYPGDSRGSQSPWHAFLPYLSSCNERWGPRRACRKENAGKSAKQKSMAPGGPTEKKMPVKTQNARFHPQTLRFTQRIW